MQKKEKKTVSLNINLDAQVGALLKQYCEEAGQTKTVAVERMLAAGLKDYFSQPEGKRIPK